MHVLLCFCVSILLVLVAAPPPRYRPNPRDWREYMLYGEQLPPYDPPDLGPRRIDDEFFDDFPGLTDGQKTTLKTRYRDAHDSWMRFIARNHPKAPSPEEVRARQQQLHREIGYRIRDAQRKTARERRSKLPPEGNVSVAIEKLKARRKAYLSERETEQAEKPVEDRYEFIRQELIAEEEGLKELLQEKCNAEKIVKEATAKIEQCAEEIRRKQARISELERQLQDSNITRDNPQSTDDTNASPDDGTMFEFSTERVGNGLQTFAQRVNRILQHMPQQASAGAGQREDRVVRPFGGSPKLARPLVF